MIQVIELTREEKIKMYRRMKKRDLAEMLANANEYLNVYGPSITLDLGKVTTSTNRLNPDTKFTYTWT